MECLERAYKNIEDSWIDVLYKTIPITDYHTPISMEELQGHFYPNAAISKLFIYIWTMESFLYKEVSRASRVKDHSKVFTVGPFAYAMAFVIAGASQYRNDVDNKKFTDGVVIYRGTALTDKQMEH